MYKKQYKLTFICKFIGNPTIAADLNNSMLINN